MLKKMILNGRMQHTATFKHSDLPTNMPKIDLFSGGPHWIYLLDLNIKLPCMQKDMENNKIYFYFCFLIVDI